MVAGWSSSHAETVTKLKPSSPLVGATNVAPTVRAGAITHANGSRPRPGRPATTGVTEVPPPSDPAAANSEREQRGGDHDEHTDVHAHDEARGVQSDDKSHRPEHQCGREEQRARPVRKPREHGDAHNGKQEQRDDSDRQQAQHRTSPQSSRAAAHGRSRRPAINASGRARRLASPQAALMDRKTSWFGR